MPNGTNTSEFLCNDNMAQSKNPCSIQNSTVIIRSTGRNITATTNNWISVREILRNFELNQTRFVVVDAQCHGTSHGTHRRLDFGVFIDGKLCTNYTISLL